MKICPSCDGTRINIYDGTAHDCQVCNGEGKIMTDPNFQETSEWIKFPGLALGSDFEETKTRIDRALDFDEKAKKYLKRFGLTGRYRGHTFIILQGSEELNVLTEGQYFCVKNPDGNVKVLVK